MALQRGYRPNLDDFFPRRAEGQGSTKANGKSNEANEDQRADNRKAWELARGLRIEKPKKVKAPKPPAAVAIIVPARTIAPRPTKCVCGRAESKGNGLTLGICSHCWKAGHYTPNVKDDKAVDAL